AINTIQAIGPGHVLVIPRAEVDAWSDLHLDTRSHLMRVSHQLANALIKAYQAQRSGLMIAVLGVPRTHIHLVPMDSMADLDFAFVKNAEQDDLAQAAEHIRAALAAG